MWLNSKSLELNVLISTTCQYFGWNDYRGTLLVGFWKLSLLELWLLLPCVLLSICTFGEVKKLKMKIPAKCRDLNKSTLVLHCRINPSKFNCWRYENHLILANYTHFIVLILLKALEHILPLCQNSHALFFLGQKGNPEWSSCIYVFLLWSSVSKNPILDHWLAEVLVARRKMNFGWAPK